MKKVLLVTTVSGFVPQFEMNNIAILKEMGYEIHYASNYNNPSYGNDNSRLDGTGIIRHQIDFSRSPYSKQTYIAYKQLKKLMMETQFDLVHCHTPMGGALARLAAKNTNTEPVIYTAHGFHFYKGAPIQNILIYKTMEKWLAHYTDALITINQEDYAAAQKFKFKKNGKAYYVPGVGIDTQKYKEIEINRKTKRKELGIPENAFVLLSVGELNKNKNHQVILKALSQIEEKNIYYLICGKGELREYLLDMSRKLKIEDKVRLLGFRDDIGEICKISDVFVFPSKREGLGLAALEAMACGLPLITSNIHGIKDYAINWKSALTCEPANSFQFVQAIKQLRSEEVLYESMSKINLELVKRFDAILCKKKMKSIYQIIKNKDGDKNG